jgi:hypothetical protein
VDYEDDWADADADADADDLLEDADDYFGDPPRDAAPNSENVFEPALEDPDRLDGYVDLPQCPLSPDSEQLLQESLSRIEASIGRALRPIVKFLFERTLRWAEHHHVPEKGPFVRFARALLIARWKRIKASYPWPERRREILDDRARTRVASGGDECYLAVYLQHWAARIDRLLGGAKSRWHVPAMTPEEIRDALVVRLLEEVRYAGADQNPRLPCEYFERPGEEATLRFLSRAKDRLRVGRHAFVPPDDFNPALLYGSGGTAEDQLVAADAEAKLKVFLERAPATMTKPMRTWFDAALAYVKNDAVTNINWAELALWRGKNRATATRARDGIRDTLERLGVKEFV